MVKIGEMMLRDHISNYLRIAIYKKISMWYNFSITFQGEPYEEIFSIVFVNIDDHTRLCGL